MSLFLGIDVGTSGVRSAVIDAAGNEIASASAKMEPPIQIEGRPCQDPKIWWAAVCECLATQRRSLSEADADAKDIAALAVDGTSGTLLITDSNLQPLTLGYMYNSGGFREQAVSIDRFASANSLGRGEGSTLARLLFLQEQCVDQSPAYALHQADWIAAKLMGPEHAGLSDETNVLKMGYDLIENCWPDWFGDCGVQTDLLPQVKPVGAMFATISSSCAAQFGLSAETRVIAGTTDSNAAFLASGASKIGDGVTSLGTTLAIKLLSDKPIVDRERGVYSHRIKDMWLPGGASNSGGGVLLDYFSAEQMQTLQKQLRPETPTGMNYYPLSKPGERFPIADPELPPRVTPRPANDADFFQALLEGISEIERLGYTALTELGAPPLSKVLTCGGGAKNEAWRKIRAQRLRIPVGQAASTDASVGTARIAAGLI